MKIAVFAIRYGHPFDARWCMRSDGPTTDATDPTADDCEASLAVLHKQADTELLRKCPIIIK